MGKFIKEKDHVLLIILMIIGLLFSIFRISTLNYDKQYEEDQKVLYSYEQQIEENFERIYEIEGTKLSITEDKYIVTIYAKDHGLELEYTKDYTLISKEIITVYTEGEYIFIYICLYFLFIPILAYRILMVLFPAIFNIITFLKKSKTKVKKE